MRRSEREVTDAAQIASFLDGEKVLRVAFYDDGDIYIVPVNYGLVKENGQYCFYFHGAKAGRKYGLAQASPRVGFEIDGQYALIESESACGHSASYMSVIGTGTLHLVDDAAECIAGLNAVMRQATGRGDWDFPESAVSRTAVFRLDVEKMSCKRREMPH